MNYNIYINFVRFKYSQEINPQYWIKFGECIFFSLEMYTLHFYFSLNELQRKKLSSLQFIGYCHYQHLLSVTIRYLQDLQKENDIFSPNFIRKDKQEDFLHRVRNRISLERCGTERYQKESIKKRSENLSSGLGYNI